MLTCHQSRITEVFRKRGKHIKTVIFAIGLLSGIIISPAASATTYYVATTGSDTSGIGTLSYPWKTIQKAATVMVAGDTCSIMAGTYRETVIPANSGSPGRPITFQTYGVGDVIISGADTLPVSGQVWTREGTSNIYFTPMNWTLGDGNQVFQGSAMMPEARWPNNSNVWQGSRSATIPVNTYTDTWSYMDTVGYTGGTNGWFTDAALPSINWTGCIVHAISGDGWLMWHPDVTGYDNTLHKLTTNHNYGNSPAYAFKTGNEYYISGSKSLMDSAGEWFYDSANFRLYFYSSSGAPSNVEAKKRNYGFDLSGKSHITLVYLHFWGCTVKTDPGSTYCQFNLIHMQYLNHSRKNSSFYGITLNNNCVLRNSELAYDSQGLVQLAGNDIRVINNNFHDSGYMPTWTATIAGSGNRNLISHNTLHDSGRALQGSIGSAGIYEHNNLYNAMKLTTDGGIFYDANVDAGNTIVRYNLLHDSLGPNGHSGGQVAGFYLDSNSCGWIVHHNIIWNVSSNAMLLNSQHGFDMVFNNTCWNAGALLTVSSNALEDSGARIFNNLFTGLPVGTWDNADIRYNLYIAQAFANTTNPSLSTFFQLPVESLAINTGTDIPLITDDAVGQPDMGALESGVAGTRWPASCGYKATAPSPDPIYNFPALLFCNQVKNGGFESDSFSPDWSTTGTVSLISQDSWLYPATNTRSGMFSAKLSSNGAEVNQTVSGLQPDRRYILYAAVKKMNANDNITIGVKNYGRSELVTTAEADASWHMYSLPFVTGPTSTSAQMYVHAATVANAAYVDDAGIVLYAVEDTQPPMPIVHYSFDETSGLVAHDRTTRGLDGTLCGSMTDADWVDGKFGNALDFDGINDYVDCGNDTSLQLTGDLTLSFWIKPTNVGSALLSPLDKNYNGEFGLNIGTDGCLNYYQSRLTAWWRCTPIPAGKIQNNVWQHIIVTRNTATRTIKGYYNGQLISVATYPSDSYPVASGNPVTIGDGSQYPIAGQMDDIRIYDCALTDVMVEDIHNVDVSKVLHLRFDESTGATTAWDCSGKGNHGIMTNMTPASDWVDGKIKGALDFDGTNDYVNCGNDTSLQLTGDLTLSFWIKPTNVGSALLSPLDKNIRGEFGLYLNTDGCLYYYHHSDVSPNWWRRTMIPSGTIQNNDTWQHIVITRDTATRTIKGYYNGELLVTATYPATQTFPVASSSHVRIGAGSGGYPAPIAGQMDDIRIYSRCLDWEEILDLTLMLDYPYEGF